MSTNPASILYESGPRPIVEPLLALTSLHKALADSLRLQILRLLKSESFSVLELCRILDIRQSALSHHLKILLQAGLVSTRREGNSIFYRRALVNDHLDFAESRRHILEAVDILPISTSQNRKIRQIQQERALSSLQFFRRNADKFREKQGLIVEHDQYAASLHDVIAGLGLERQARVLEVGPGEGQLLAELAERFQRLTALDNSPDMLEKARATIADAGHKGVEFLLGETRSVTDRQFDLIIFNMVLHHIPSPAMTIRDCARLLAPAGTLLLCDLSRHDQDWVRESCGDLWLGFETDDLHDWANQAGLEDHQGSFLSLRNGFQIQVRMFRKKRDARAR